MSSVAHSHTHAQRQSSQVRPFDDDDIFMFFKLFLYFVSAALSFLSAALCGSGRGVDGVCDQNGNPRSIWALCVHGLRGTASKCRHTLHTHTSQIIQTSVVKGLGHSASCKHPENSRTGEMAELKPTTDNITDWSWHCVYIVSDPLHSWVNTSCTVAKESQMLVAFSGWQYSRCHAGPQLAARTLSRAYSRATAEEHGR